MKLFKYKGQYLTGEKAKGIAVGTNKEEVRRILRNRGIFTKTKDIKEKNPWLWSKIPLMPSDWHFIFSSLAKLINNIPPQEAIQILIEDQINPKVAFFLLKVREAMEEGLVLSQAFEKAGAPKEIVLAIKNGESTGELLKILETLSDVYEERTALLKELINSSIFPLIIFAFLFVVMFFYLPPIIVSFSKVLKSAIPHYKLPTITLLIISISKHLPTYGTIIFLLIPASILMARHFYKKSLSFKKTVDKMIISFPIIGKGYIAFNLYKNFLSFYMLYKTGFPIREILEDLVKSTNNYYLKRAWKIIYDSHIRDSLPLSDAFALHPYIPIPVKNFINIGYRSGELIKRLEDSLFYLRERYQTYMNFVKQFITPALFIITFIIVTVALLAVVMPMFKLMDSLKNLM